MNLCVYIIMNDNIIKDLSESNAMEAVISFLAFGDSLVPEEKSVFLPLRKNCG